MWVTEILSTAIALLLYCWFKNRYRRMSLLQRNGINGPQWHWIWGNLREYLATPNVLWDAQITSSGQEADPLPTSGAGCTSLRSNLIKLPPRYGPICGYYFGAKPVVLVTELALLERIQQSEGNGFLDRPRRVPGGISPDPKRAEMLGNLKVPEWRALRAILSRGFSPAKLRSMSSDARNQIAVLMSLIPETSGAERSVPFDFYALYQNLTLEVIGKTGFGVNSNIQRNPNDALKAAVEQEFSKSTSSIILKLYLCFPELQWILQPIRVWIEKVKQHWGFGGRSELWDLGLATVSQRQQSQQQQPSPDLLEVMISSGKLSEISMVANSVLFFEAGFETLSASLAFITDLLMNHMAIQDDVRSEIKDFAKNGGQLQDITQLARLTFLDAVIKEGLRMYPPQTTFIGRSGERDITHDYRAADGIMKTCTIPRKTHIQVGLHQILNSSQIWDTPGEFRPYRFLDGLTNDQKIAYQPFGKGKRICIGQKYAEMILKMVLISILSQYRIFPVRDRQPGEEIEVVYKTATMTPKHGVYGCVVRDPLISMEVQL